MGVSVVVEQLLQRISEEGRQLRSEFARERPLQLGPTQRACRHISGNVRAEGGRGAGRVRAGCRDVVGRGVTVGDQHARRRVGVPGQRATVHRAECPEAPGGMGRGASLIPPTPRQNSLHFLCFFGPASTRRGWRDMGARVFTAAVHVKDGHDQVKLALAKASSRQHLEHMACPRTRRPWRSRN